MKIYSYFTLLTLLIITSISSPSFAVVLGVPDEDFKNIAETLGFGTDTDSLKMILQEQTIVKPALEKAGFTQEGLAQGLNLFFNKVPNFPKRIADLQEKFMTTTSTGKKINKLSALLVTCKPGAEKGDDRTKKESERAALKAEVAALCQSANYCGGTSRLACLKTAFNLVVKELFDNFLVNELTGETSIPYQILGLRSELKPIQSQYKKNIVTPANNLIKIVNSINTLIQSIPTK